MGGIDASATTLPVTNLNRYNIGDILQIESELMVVREISTTDDELTVSRGFRLSTAAAHLAAVAIAIHPEFTDRLLNQTINSAIADTYPNIWLEIKNDDDLVTDVDEREYDSPSGFTFVRRIQVANADGFFLENRDWEMIGTMIKFNRSFTESGRAIRVIGQYYQPQLSDDSTNLDIADEQAEYVFYNAALLALETRLGPRLKATQYSASVNERAGQPTEMIQMYRYLQNECQMIKFRETKPHISGYMTRSVR